ncbi:MAG: radical SAM protein [Sphaerochaetaceae bacterium]
MANLIKRRGTEMVAKMAYRYLEGNPEENLPKLLNFFDAIDTKDVYKSIRTFVHDILDKKDGNWYEYMLSFWKDIDPSVLKVFFNNFLINTTLIGNSNKKEMAALHECELPWAILMDPTSSCNLHCTGCWAADYGNKLSMDYSTLDSIIKQGKALGTYMYIYSGGEPLMRKKDIIALCEAHPDCAFLAFTNGTLIDEAFADEMLRVKNFYPAFSIEGFAAATDSRRGKGTYEKVVTAMEILRRKKLLYGVSCCYTSENVEEIGSEAYIDHIIDLGAKFAWFFTYIPVGQHAVPSLIASAEQREFMYHQLRAMRKTKPIFTMDFWNDGEFVGGCIAGGRRYLHINANGDIEPCAFIHYSDSNIHTHTLLEAYKNPLFQQYQKNQPFNQNQLRPCPLLDNPSRLREMVHASGATSTDLESKEDVDSLTAKCEDASQNWAVTAERLWKQ